MIVCYHVFERIYILSKDIIKFIEEKSNNEQIEYFLNVIFLIEELNLRFADMWTYEIFKISNI